MIRVILAVASMVAAAPGSLPLLDAVSEVREGLGDRAGAVELAAKCATALGTDWQANAAIARCRERLARLRPSP